MSFSLSIASVIDTFNRRLGKTVACLTVFMAVLMFINVVLRYAFNLGWIALQESILYMHAAVFLLGAAYTYQADEHVRVDIFYRQFSQRGRNWVNFLGALLLLLPVSLFILISCWHYVVESWQIKEASMESGGLPFLYRLKTSIVIFAFTLCLQALSDVLRCGVRLFSQQKVS